MKLKQCLLIFALALLSYNIFGASEDAFYRYDWDSGVLSAYFFENNGNDDNGAYNLVVKGTGPVYKTDLVYEGSYSYSVQNNANYLALPQTLVDALANTNNWSITGEIYMPLGGSGYWGLFISGVWNYFSVAFKQEFENQGRAYLIYDGVEISTLYNTTANTFKTVSIEWDGNNAKLWVDGVVVIDRADTDNVFAKQPTYEYSINRTSLSYFNQNDIRNDRYVFSNKLRLGQRVIPISLAKIKYTPIEEMLYHSKEDMEYAQ